MLFKGVVEQEIKFTKSLTHYPIECYYCSDYGFNFTSPLHWHFYSEIIYVHEGEHEITVEDQSIYIKKGDVLYIHPQRIHIARMNSSKKTALSVVKFDTDVLFYGENSAERQMFAPFLEQSKMDFIHLSCVDGKIDSLFKDILLLQNEKNIETEYELKNTLCRLMLALLYEYKKKHDDTLVVVNNYEHVDDLLYGVVRYINCNFENEIATEDLLRLCGMSYSYFAKCFKNYTGKTLIEYINHVRIAKAQRLLAASEMPVVEIAISCGFNDASYFVRVFKKLLHKTPSEFRHSV